MRDHNEHFHQVITPGSGLPIGIRAERATTMVVNPPERGMNNEQRTRLSCLQMANLHATPQQIADGQVYKIADDFYEYIINGKK